ncbi:MAG: ABC transporter substrate-binding protein, partial [Dehalococcoidia bacterium]
AQVASEDNWPPPVVYTPSTGTQAVTTAQECAEDLTGEQIVIYQQAGTEGPIASILGLAFQFATTQALKEINEAGGICGAELVVEFRETAYNVDQEVIAYEETRDADPAPFVINTYNSGATVALSDRFNEDHIAAIAAGVNTQAIYVPRDGWTIGIVPVYADQFAGFCDWVTSNWADVKPESAGDDIVIGVIGWQGAYGSGATTPEAIAYCESVGATVLELEQQEISPAYDSTGNIQALLAQGANVIYQQNLSFSSAEVVGTVTALGVRDQVLLGGVNWSGNFDVLNFLGENVGIMDGYYTITPYIPWDETDHPGIQQTIAAFDASGAPPNERTFTFLMTYAGFYNQKRVIEHAINRDGFPVTGDTFMDAFKDLGTVDELGILQWTVEGEQRSPGRTRISQFQLVDGEIQLVPVTDWFELPKAWPPG